jgi:hypothetical protein
MNGAMRRSHVLVLLSLMSLAGCSGCSKDAEQYSEDGLKIIEIRSDEAVEFEKMADRARKPSLWEKMFGGGIALFYPLGSISFDDGSSYAVRVEYATLNGESIRVESKGPRHKPHYYRSEKRQDGYSKRSFSAYGDEIIDVQAEKTPGREVILYDRDRNGFFEERLTQTFIPETKSIHRVLEKRSSPEGEWTVMEESEEPSLGRRPKKT